MDNHRVGSASPIQRFSTHDVRLAAIATIGAPRVTTLLDFNALLAGIQGLATPCLQEESLAALGADIAQLPLREQQVAIDGFLEEVQNYVGPRSNFLAVVVHGAVDGPAGLRASLQLWRGDPEMAVAHGPAREAVLSAIKPGNSGERWHSVADRMGITRPGLRDYLHTSVAHGPAREAVLFATQLGGSGEHWSSVANRMGITGPRLRGYLQRAVAQGPATQAILSAMQPGGSGECWSSVADRMGITDPALRHYLSRVRLGD